MDPKLKALRGDWLGLTFTAIFVAENPALGFTVNSAPLTPTEKNIETLGTGVAIALPIVGLVIAVLKRDRVPASRRTRC